MKMRLEDVTASMDADFERKLVDVGYLVQSNAFSAALKLGLKSQLTEFTLQERNLHKSLNRILVADGKNNILFNTTGFIKRISDVHAMGHEYSCFIYCERILRIHYIPVFDNAHQRKGTIISVFDFSDFHNSIAGRLKGTSYKAYGFVDRNASFILDENGVAFMNIPLRSSPDKLAEGYSYITIDGDRNLFSIKSCH